MAKNKPCPIPGCRRKWRTKSGLRAHLYRDHNKTDLIGIILNQMPRIVE